MGTRVKLSPQLVIIDGKDKGKVISLQEGTSVVGRSRADVTVADPRISRSHVAIHFDSRTGKLTYTDLKSLNGTLVNGDKTETGELKDGDRIQIGDTIFDCQLVQTSETQKAPAPKVHKVNSMKRETAEIIVPLNENSEKEERTADPLTPIEPLAPPPLRPPDVENEPRTLIGITNRAFLKIPPQRRKVAAIVVLALFPLIYWTRGGNSSQEIARQVASIQQLEQEGKIEVALNKAEALCKQFPNRSEGFVKLGTIYANKNMINEAIASFEKAHVLPPEESVVHVKLIRLYLRAAQATPDKDVARELQKKAQGELEDLEKVIKAKKFSKELFVEAASIFLEFKELKQPPEKTLILAKALQKEYAPNEAIGYKLEAQLHFQENRPQDALDALSTALKFAPQDEWILENMVFGRLELKDFAGSEKALDDWLNVRPTATKALLIYAYLKYNEKNYAHAMPFISKILQIAANDPSDPHYPEALNLMGQIYVALGQNADAANFFRQSCQAGFTQACDNNLIAQPTTPPPPAPKVATPQPTTRPPAALPRNPGSVRSGQQKRRVN